MAVWRRGPRSVGRDSLRARADEPALRDGTYLTDGRRLLRVVSQFTAAPRKFAELEDCLTLEVERYSPLDLWRMNLRTVAPAPDPEAGCCESRPGAGARPTSPLASR